MSVIDTLKAVGVPVTAAAVISALVVSVPLLFKIDERYAKEEDLKREVATLHASNNQLQRELAQLAGFQQAMTTFIAEGRIPRPAAAPTPTPSIPPLNLPSPLPPPTAAPQPNPVAIPPSTVFAPEAVTSAPTRPIEIEQPRNWRELNEGLVRQQKRLQKE